MWPRQTCRRTSVSNSSSRPSCSRSTKKCCVRSNSRSRPMLAASPCTRPWKPTRRTEPARSTAAAGWRRAERSTSDQFHAVHTLRQGVRIAALGELDLQPHFVGRVGVTQCVLVRDIAGVIQLDQTLVESAHAQVGRFLHYVLDLVDLALANVVLDQRRAEQHFDRDAAGLAIGPRNELLRDDRLEVE